MINNPIKEIANTVISHCQHTEAGFTPTPI